MDDIQSHIKRHIGAVTNTGARIYLVYRKLPDDDEHCLCIMADSLPDQYSDNVHGLVMSREAQNTVDLYEVLHRHTFNDGENVLETLHHRGFLKKLNVSDVNMIPLTGRPVALSIINADIDGKSEDVAEVAEVAAVPTPTALAPAPISDSVTTASQVAELLAKAGEMEATAKSLREAAHTIDPDSKKAGRPNSGLTEAEKKEKRNAKRREAYKAKTAKS